MQNDLISRSALIQILQEFAENDWNKSLGVIFTDCVDTCIDFVENQPTAYDVEKVLEQLEENMDEAKYMRYEGVLYIGQACAYKYAIEIVRNGGKAGVIDE